MNLNLHFRLSEIPNYLFLFEKLSNWKCENTAKSPDFNLLAESSQDLSPPSPLVPLVKGSKSPKLHFQLSYCLHEGNWQFIF